MLTQTILSDIQIFLALGALVYGVMHLRLDNTDYSQPNKGMCLAASSLAIFGVTLSQLMTAAIGIDRYNGINAPVSYRKRNHKVFAVRCFAAILLYDVATCSLLPVGVNMSEIPDQCGAGSSATKPWIIVSECQFFNLYITALEVLIANQAANQMQSIIIVLGPVRNGRLHVCVHHLSADSAEIPSTRSSSQRCAYDDYVQQARASRPLHDLDDCAHIHCPFW